MTSLDDTTTEREARPPRYRIDPLERRPAVLREVVRPRRERGLAARLRALLRRRRS